MQTRQVQSALTASFDDCLGDAAHIILNGWIWQLIFMIRHSPSAAWAKMPFAPEPNFLCQIQRHLNRRNQRFRVTKVRTLMKMNPFQRQVMFPTKFCSFQNLPTRHAKLTVLLPGLRMRVVSSYRKARQEAQPEILWNR